MRAYSVMSDSLGPHGLCVACQTHLSKEFSRQEYFFLQGIFSTQRLNQRLQHWQAFFSIAPAGEPIRVCVCVCMCVICYNFF